MRVILDECVPSIVKRGLPGHNIVTVQEMGWAGIKNGKLLRLVEEEFDVFVTSDKNIRYQQNLASIDLTFIILPSNQVPVIQALLPRIDIALSAVTSNELIEI